MATQPFVAQNASAAAAAPTTFPMAQPAKPSPAGNDGIYLGGQGSLPVGNQFQYPPTAPPAYVPVLGADGTPGMAPMQQVCAAPPPMAPNVMNHLMMMQAQIQSMMNAQGQGQSQPKPAAFNAGEYPNVAGRIPQSQFEKLAGPPPPDRSWDWSS